MKATLPLFLICIFLFSFTGINDPDPREGKLFKLVSPKHSGISFSNDIIDTRAHSILIYSNYYGGAGVGIGDINNDGLPDLYLAGNLVPDKLYLNKGNLQFEDITEKAGIMDNGGWSSGVLFGDVNQDGFTDIYVTRELYDDNPELRKNKLYINNGDNTFTESAEEYKVDDNQRTRHATFLDYDKDGDLDLFLLNQPPNPGDYSPYFGKELLIDEYACKLLENQGNSFKDVTKKAGLFKTGFPNSVTASDLNNDGWTDLYVSNDFWAGDWLYFNNGDGTFTNKIDESVKHISFSSMGVDAGDINNDGKLDLMVVDMVAEDNYRLKANMGGMNPKAFWKVVNDGGHYQYMFNTFQLNLGEEKFSEIAQLAGVASTDWSWSNLFADLDNDGWKDIFVTNGLLRDIRNTDSNKKFKEYVEGSIKEYLAKNPNPDENVGVWDIADMQKAIAFSPSEKLQNYAFRNKGDLTFQKVNSDWGFEEKLFSNGSAYADLDNDGDLDLVINNVNDLASIYENKATEISGHNYLRIIPKSEEKSVARIGTKVWLEASGEQQYFEITGVRGMYSTSEEIVHFGLGKHKKADKIIIQWPDGNQQELKNVKANQVIEVNYHDAKPVSNPEKPLSQTLFSNITTSANLSFKHVENEFDDYTMQVLLPHKMSGLGPCLAKGDVNNDGLEDFYAGGSTGNERALFIQKPDGTFIKQASPALSGDKFYEDLGATFFDADGDKDLDLYVVSGGNEFEPQSEMYQDRLYLNDGKGNFETSKDLIPEMRTSGSKVRAADFDKDGDLDLFVAGRHIPWAYPEPASSTLLLNENGKFVDVTQQMAKDLINIGMVNDGKWMDFNGDGLLDLVLAGEWMPITFLENKGSEFVDVTATLGLQDKTGWWFGLEAADIDNDGDMDLVAGNLGLNYKYKASDQEPFEVYYNDFDKNGKKDIVLAYYNFGTLYPLRGKSCSSEQVPMLNTKFKTYDMFASSELSDIYGNKNLDKSLHYEANTFASAYIENLGDGKFEFHALPVEAQFSVGNDIIIEDFDHDKKLDILIAGNLYDAEVETARNDAGYGVFLKGNGKGDFKSIHPEKSGFFTPYDVKSLEVIESNSGKIIIVGSNNDYLQAFRVSKSDQ
ncbi:VCBS repeat-containing protein [Flexithrix dorotheae]|uniref:VCBS repeat-containing protein n=1 Tax=Flexithrix dorotheae TaxID=70993 RepID=UPI000360E056|nr:VCBS repeat-containing protein [Flexithrix dorotheae]